MSCRPRVSSVILLTNRTKNTLSLAEPMKASEEFKGKTKRGFDPTWWNTAGVCRIQKCKLTCCVTGLWTESTFRNGIIDIVDVVSFSPTMARNTQLVARQSVKPSISNGLEGWWSVLLLLDDFRWRQAVRCLSGISAKIFSFSL